MLFRSNRYYRCWNRNKQLFSGRSRHLSVCHGRSCYGGNLLGMVLGDRRREPCPALAGNRPRTAYRCRGGQLMPTSPKSHKGPIAGTYTEVRKKAAERGYNHRWQKARATYLGRNELCAACMKEGRPTLATVVDHIVDRKSTRLNSSHT